MATKELQVTTDFEVQPNKQYYIIEKPTDETDDALRKEGRSKKLAYAFETVGCPYDEYNKSYDTGLDKYSKEFTGKPAAQITATLRNRKPLRDTLTKLTKGDVNKEEEVIAGLKLKVTHDRAINTANPNEYLRLYFAMRGSIITPPTETNNFAKYGRSMYVLVDREAKKSTKDDHIKKVYTVISHVTNLLSNNKQAAFELLRYVNLLGPTEVKEPSYLLETVHTLIQKDYKMLIKLHDVIEEKDEQEIRACNKLVIAYSSGKVKKEEEGYFFNDVFLGLDLKTAAGRMIKDNSKEGKELLVSILEA